MNNEEENKDVEALEEEFKKTFTVGLSSEALAKEGEFKEAVPTGGMQQRIKELQDFKNKLEQKIKEKKGEANQNLEQLKKLKEEFASEIKEIKGLEETYNKIVEEIEKLTQMREEVLSLEEEARTKLE